MKTIAETDCQVAEPMVASEDTIASSRRMIHLLRPYSAYRESGIPWLRTVPEHWQVQRIKTLFCERDERSGNESGVLLSLTRVRGIIRQSDASSRLAGADDLSKYKVCRPGDLVMNRMQAWSGMFGLSSMDGLVSPDYSVFTAIVESEGKYFEHLFKTPLLVDQFAQRSRGIGSGFNRLYTPDFSSVPVVVPPVAEQSAIVRFLDHADRQIRRYIHAKQRLIKLLAEQKQAIIQRAVTRGLNPDVRLEPSGVDWLGDMPAHWEVTRLKFLASDIVDCLHATPNYTDQGEFPAIRTADVEPGCLLVQNAKRVDRGQYDLWTARLVPQCGDILYTREGERFGLAAVVPPGVSVCISQRMMAFRIRRPHDSDYVMWQLNCPHVYAQAVADVIGATSPHVNVETIRNYNIVVPPPSEQVEIARWITKECSSLDKTIDRTATEIDLLREYRVRLITDVVTGKLDVRGAAVAFQSDELASSSPTEDEDSAEHEEPGVEESVELEAAGV